MIAMDQMLPEVISHIFGFLSLSDRKEAALVCRKWYNASLHPSLQKHIIMKCRPPQGEYFITSEILGRKITHLTFGDTVSPTINEDSLVSLLNQCPSLVGLDLSGCNSLFLSGRLLAQEKDQLQLRETMRNVQELKLARLRHMTDITFSRLVYVFENISSISVASSNIIFGTNYSTSNNSLAVFQFVTFVNFVGKRASKMKSIDLSHTAVNDQALSNLSKVAGLYLDEMFLCGCMELSDKGIKFLAQAQGSLRKLDLSGSKELGNSKVFFKTFVENLKQLHTLSLRKCPRVGQCDIASLGNLSSLRDLDLGEALNLYQADLVKGLCSPHLALSSLHVAYCPDINDTFVVALCETNPSLRQLDLTGCKRISDASIHAISQNLLSLRSLKLAYCSQLTDLGILGYVPENGVAYRRSFEFDHDSCCCQREKESRIFRKPTGCLKHYRSAICKAQTQIESGGILFNLSNLSLLQTLDLASCSNITDMGIIEAVQFKDLRHLSLNNLRRLTDKSVQHLVRMNPSLEDVGLRGCGEITDVAVNALATHSPCLSSLDVSQNDKLTKDSIQRITAKCKRLRHLDISFCGNVMVDTVMQLESKYPNVKFQFRPHIFV